jgi:hypothetical protein
LLFKPLLYFCPFPALLLSIFALNAPHLPLFATVHYWLEFSPSPSNEKIRLPTPFAPVALSAGRRGNGRRYSFGCKPLSALPHHPFFYRVPSVWGIAPSSLRLFFFYRRRATEEAATGRDFSLYGFHSVLPRPAAAGICFSGAGLWAAKKCKDTAVGRRLPKNRNARVVQSASGFASRALAFRFFPP